MYQNRCSCMYYTCNNDCRHILSYLGLDTSLQMKTHHWQQNYRSDSTPYKKWTMIITIIFWNIISALVYNYHLRKQQCIILCVCVCSHQNPENWADLLLFFFQDKHSNTIQIIMFGKYSNTIIVNWIILQQFLTWKQAKYKKWLQQLFLSHSNFWIPYSTPSPSAHKVIQKVHRGPVIGFNFTFTQWSTGNINLWNLRCICLMILLYLCV